MVCYDFQPVKPALQASLVWLPASSEAGSQKPEGFWASLEASLARGAGPHYKIGLTLKDPHQ
jgi:hypothetical protein